MIYNFDDKFIYELLKQISIWVKNENLFMPLEWIGVVKEWVNDYVQKEKSGNLPEAVSRNAVLGDSFYLAIEWSNGSPVFNNPLKAFTTKEKCVEFIHTYPKFETINWTMQEVKIFA